MIFTKIVITNRHEKLRKFIINILQKNSDNKDICKILFKTFSIIQVKPSGCFFSFSFCLRLYGFRFLKSQNKLPWKGLLYFRILTRFLDNIERYFVNGFTVLTIELKLHPPRNLVLKQPWKWRRIGGVGHNRFLADVKCEVFIGNYCNWQPRKPDQPSTKLHVHYLVPPNSISPEKPT